MMIFEVAVAFIAVGTALELATDVAFIILERLAMPNIITTP